MIANAEQDIIVVSWDFSANSRAGLKQAMRLANRGGQVHVVHVAAHLSGPDNGALYTFAEQDKRRELGERLRNELAAELKQNAIGLHVLFGNPGSEIASFADRVRARTIILPPRGKRSVLDLLSGGLAKQVERHTRRPVTVIQAGNCPVNVADNVHRSPETPRRSGAKKPNSAKIARRQQEPV